MERTVAARWPLVGRSEDLEACCAALTEGEARALFIHGAAGVGKSRLAEEIVGRITNVERATVRVRANLASAAIPLGAVAHLLPMDLLDGQFDPLTVYGRVVASLRAERAGRGPLVVLVDDAHWLDPTSAALLGQLLDGGEIMVVGTVRTGDGVSATVAGVWSRDDVHRLDLTELTFDDADTLLHLALGGPIDRQAISRLWSASAGNPLILRELVLGAVSRGDMVQRRSVWWLTGSLASTPRLTEIIGQRIDEVHGAARDALEVLAVWGSVGLHELATTSGGSAVEDLERAGLVDVVTDGRRQTVRLAHPLHGEVLRDRLPITTRLRLLTERAAVLERYGARRREDLLLIVNARLEAGAAVDPALIAQAARVARFGHDFGLVERLTTGVQPELSTAETVLLRAEALHELSDYAEVEQLLAACPIVPAMAEPLAVRLTAMRVRNLMWGLHRADEALQVNRAARDVLTSTDSIDELVTDEALTLVHSNRPGQALQALEQMSAEPAPRARVLRDIAMVPALTAVGRCETAAALTARAHAEHRALGDQTAIAHPGVHLVHRMDALLDAGELAEARALALIGYERSARGGPPLGRDWFALGLGKAALLGGQPRTAMRWLAECVELSSTTGFDGPRRLELSYLATAQAWAGEVDEARRSVAEQAAVPSAPFRQIEQRLGAAWVAAAAGDLSAARRQLLDAADEADGSEQRSAAAWLLHDVARLGGADEVTARLDELARHCEGPRVAAYADGVRALARRDGVTLDEVTARYERLEMWLLAAEASTAAAGAHRRVGARRAAATAAARAAAALTRCEGARTPGLVDVETVVPLTKREREVAGLAAAGRSSRAIAQQLYLSERTVENHLQNVYTKLGVASRSELAEVLGAAGSDVGR